MNNGNMPVKRMETFPTLFDDFFKPWREWFDMGWDKVSTVPAVNVTEADGNFKITLAAPGLQKEDFKIDVDGNLITISAEKSTQKEEKDEKFTRKEYNFTSFSRTFTLPDNVMADKIEARYENGELKLMLPKLADAKAPPHKKIEIR
ncbi:MAG TPA: Hsp20/alpha crystallin family protein [Lacibacter sp.]|nr:Hsp20/alpha crystallin family protein [Lacibacter sp.]HMO88290.1 Hsp20/alpha crystallin family protein [Lacibacter sp.]HMP87102.1 Hsp20/alpha crystallin family protein [Lacibacter sp.]